MGQTTDKLSPSALKAKRRKAPIFVDEPIQWHLRSSKRDRCPWCGSTNVGYLNARKRLCMNKVCEMPISLRTSKKEWLEDKLNGTLYGGANPPFIVPSSQEEGQSLEEAWQFSNTNRAYLVMQTQGSFVKIFWHKIGHVPEDEQGNRCVAPGSDYWRYLLQLREQPIWLPEEPLSEMEVIAKTAFEED